MTTFIQPDYTFGNSKDCQDQMIGVLQNLDQALQALEPSPNTTTVQFNDTLLLKNNTTINNTLKNDNISIIDTSTNENVLINKNSIYIKDNSIGYSTTSSIEIENNNSTPNNLVGIPSMEFYKSGRIGAPADIIMSQQFNALNYLGAKTTFGKIECSITSNNIPGSGGIDGALDFYTCVNGSNNNVFRLNGQDNENNTFRPFDLNGNLLKTSQGNILIDSSVSAGPGNISLTPKIGSAIELNGNVVMDGGEQFVQRNPAFSIYNNQTQSSINLVDTSNPPIVNSNINNTIYQQLLNENTLTTFTNESFPNLAKIKKFDKTINIDTEMTSIYSNKFIVADLINAYNSQLFATSLNFSVPQGVGGAGGSNNIDIDANSFAYQTLISSSVNDTINVYSSTIANNQFTQGIEFKLLTPTTDKLLQIGNATTANGYITYSNNLDSNPLVIASNTGVNLDTTILNLVNTSTTTSIPTHNTNIKATSTGLESNTFLKLQLNGVDIWIPYFTTDPSL